MAEHNEELTQDGKIFCNEVHHMFDVFSMTGMDRKDPGKFALFGLRDRIISLIKGRYTTKKFVQKFDFENQTLSYGRGGKAYVESVINPIGTTINKNDKYFSIVIPYYCRLSYLETLIDSIYKYADMPVEIIVHDDGSVDDSSDVLYEKFRKLVSTLIVNPNTGHNLGLPVAANRCIKMATSKYIMFLNADTVLTKSMFLDLKNILDKEYVGYVCLEDRGNNPEISNNGTEFSIRPGIGGGSAMAFRKDFWEENYQY